jgi:predicted NBD/HSP70 family sugar kinase
MTELMTNPRPKRTPSQNSQFRVSRQLSERAVFEGLLHEGPISRAELSKSTGLSKQTISEVVNAFEQRGWAQSVGRTSGAIGRTAVLYELRPESAFVVGVDLGVTKLTGAVADMSCAIRFELSEPTDARGGLAVLDQIARLTARLAREVDAQPSKVLCATIGTPGVVDRETGGIDLAPNIAGLKDFDVAAALKSRIGGRIVIENDVNLALLGEIWQGCAHDSAQVAFMALGTGVGLGLAANGRLIRGEMGAAGEIGYLPLGGDPFAAETRNQGALEYEIGAHGVLRRYRSRGGADVKTIRDVFDRLAIGDPIAAQVIDETARTAALAVASVAVLFDPGLIVMGGSLGGHQDFVARVQPHLALCAPRPIELKESALKNRAGMVGAIAAALNTLHESLFGLEDLPGELPLPRPRPHGAEATR